MKKIVFAIIFILGITSSFGAAPSLYPGVAEIDLTEGRGQGSFLMFNTGDEVKKYKITIRDVDNFGEKSLLAKHLRVFPRYVEIEPGKNKKIRFLVRNFPQDSVENGEHRASIAIEELNSTLDQKHKARESESGITTVINYRYHINMAVYGYVGELISQIEADFGNIKNSILNGTIKNTGNYSHSIACTFLDDSGEVIEMVALPKLMNREKQEVSMKIPEGAVKLQITGGKKKFLLYEEDINL